MSIDLPIPKIINQKSPSQAIILHKGLGEIIDSHQNTIKGEAVIQIYWHPFPRIGIEFTYYGDFKSGLNTVDLRLRDLPENFCMKFYIFRSSTYVPTNKNQAIGYLIESVQQGSRNKLHSLVFHLTNFYYYNISNENDWDIDENGNEIEITKEPWLDFEGQFIFDYDNWHIVLASLDTFELQEQLDIQGGYGITHICKVEHLDGTTFDLDKGHEIIDSLIYYLSFVRGLWVAPLCVSGFDSQGNKILEEWKNPEKKADYWQSIGYSWTTDDCTEIIEVFPGFMKKWKDNTWKEVIQNAIQWYIESFPKRNDYNTAIILIQSALEKLAWTYLTTNDCVNADDFSRLKASGKIRLLLKFLNVSVTPIDCNYPVLEALVKEFNFRDSIEVITEVRNLIIHPPTKSSKSKLTDPQAMTEVWKISHNYLLQCLLKLFEYPYN